MIEIVKIFTPLLVVLIMGAAAPTPKPTMPRQPSKPGVFVPKPNPPPRCPNPPRTGCHWNASDEQTTWRAKWNLKQSELKRSNVQNVAVMRTPKLRAMSFLPRTFTNAKIADI